MATLATVRRNVRDLLAASPAYRALPPARQQQVASDTVRVAAYMADPDGLVSREFRAPLLRRLARRRAAPLTVDLAPTLKGGTGVADSLLGAVDFPAFVAGLIHGVFGAIVTASIRQMQAYAELVAGVAASVDGFGNDKLGDQAARDTLATEFPELFCPKANGKPGLRWCPEANPAAAKRLRATIGPQETAPDLRGLVAAARRRLARNRQQTLATVMLMGINRIVVTDGRINANIRFTGLRTRR